MPAETENLYIGIDLGGTKILTGLITEAGELVAQDYRKTKAKRGQDAVVGRLIDSVHHLMQASGIQPGDVRALGIGAPGPVESEAGVVVSPPNLPGWDRVPLRAKVEDTLGIPTFLENDANAAALGEWCFGAGRGSEHMLYVTVSTGIGGGFILGGKLYGGSSGAAAEVGHMTILPQGPHCMCGNRGCLEAVASGTAIARNAVELIERGVPTLIADLAATDPDGVGAKLVAEAARAGDSVAEEIIREAMSFLGIGVANLVNLLNPELIVVGGSLTKMGDTLFDPVKRAVNQRAFPFSAERVRVIPAELGDQVGVIGAAAVAIQNLDRRSHVGASQDRT